MVYFIRRFMLSSRVKLENASSLFDEASRTECLKAISLARLLHFSLSLRLLAFLRLCPFLSLSEKSVVGTATVSPA